MYRGDDGFEQGTDKGFRRVLINKRNYLNEVASINKSIRTANI